MSKAGKFESLFDERNWLDFGTRSLEHFYKKIAKLSLLKLNIDALVTILGPARVEVSMQYPCDIQVKYSYGASYRVKTDKFLCTLMRDTDVMHFTEISR